LLHESAAFLDLAIDAGFTLFDQAPHGVASGVFAAPLLGKSFIDRVYCAGGVLYHSNSTFSIKTTKDSDESLCLPLLISVRAVAGLSVLTEWYFPMAGYSAGSPAYAFGFKYATWRHSFSLLLTNSQYTTVDGTVSGSDRMNNPVLGLEIVRKFGQD
jgi:hypothetical protein